MQMTVDVHILMIIEGEITTTQIIERLLAACGGMKVSYTKKLLKDLQHTDLQGKLPLFIRCADPQIIPWINYLVSIGVPYLYYIDDNFWELREPYAIAAYYQNPFVRQALNVIVKQASAIIVNAPALGEFIKQYNKHVYILRPFFDFGLIENIKPYDGPEYRIGFAGSSSRNADLNFMKTCVENIHKVYPNIYFEFAGTLLDMPPSEHVRFFPHTSDYAQYIAFQRKRGWKIGLAPLLPVKSNSFKTNNKYREYGACKIAGIYSQSATYQDSVSNRITGMIAPDNDSKTWIDIIVFLIENENERASIGLAAQCDVAKRFSLPIAIEDWLPLLYKFGAQIENNKQTFPLLVFQQKLKLRQYRLQSYLIRLTMIFNEGGIYSVIMRLWKKIRFL